MRRTAALLLGVALSVAGVAACGAQSDAYCDVLKDGNSLSLEQVDPTDQKSFKRLTERMAKAEEAAPDEVRKHWDDLTTTMKAVSEAMANPADADQAALQQAATRAQSAAEALQTDAKERCGIDV
jgi:hypothetical protein